MKQIPGQMSIFDVLEPKNDKNLQKMTEKCRNCTFHVWLHRDGKAIESCDRYDGCEYQEKRPPFDPYDYLTWCDWCTYQDETGCCTYDEPLGRFCCQGDGFKPKGKLPKPEKKTCRTCDHWRPYTHGYEDYICGHACFGFGISKSDRADRPACDTYEEREEDPDDR